MQIGIQDKISWPNQNDKRVFSSKANFAQKVCYHPSQGQKQVHLSNKRYRIVLAGARFGKSMLAGFEIAYYLMFPDCRIWCVAPVYELAEKEFNWALEFLSRYKMEDGISRLIDRAKISTPARGSKSIRMPWGSYVQTKSTENKENLLGEELDFLVLGEAACIAREPWERMLRARLGPRVGKMLAPSTGAGDNNIFAEFVANGKADDPKFADWQTWEFTTLDNPCFDKVEYERARRELDPDVFREQYEGKIVSRRGYVFKFQDEHIVQTLPEEIEQWPIVVAIQPGFKNPCAVAFIAYNMRQREYLVYDEIYLTETLMEEIIPKILEKLRGRRYLGAFSDYWMKDACDDMAKNGLATKTNDVEKKVGKMQAIIARTRVLQNVLKIREDGKPRLQIYQKCEHIIGDFRKCKWPDHPKEEAERLEAEIPLPKFFQAPQAISHAIAFFESATGVAVYESQK